MERLALRWGGLVRLALIWGSSFVWIKVRLRGFGVIGLDHEVTVQLIR